MDREVKYATKVNGVWIEGVYVKKSKVMLSPIFNGSKEERIKIEEENTQHLLIMESFFDWELPVKLDSIEIDPSKLRLKSPYKSRNGIVYLGYGIFEGMEVEDELGKTYEVVYLNNNWYVKDKNGILSRFNKKDRYYEVRGWVND